MTNVIKMNLDHIADDIRHVTDILKAREEAASQTVTPTGGFDLAAEIRKENRRALSSDFDRRVYRDMSLSVLQADLTQAMMDFGISPVVDRIVAARNDALVKGGGMVASHATECWQCLKPLTENTRRSWLGRDYCGGCYAGIMQERRQAAAEERRGYREYEREDRDE